jgi:tRNA threonylcarbamoyladenosine biosynthesis protein TsaE
MTPASHSLRCDDVSLLGDIAQSIIQKSIPHRVFLLHGGMGAGKTTLVKALCKYLGVVDQVTSPTFSLVNEYATSSGDTIYHFDLYRLEKESEALDFGMEDYLCSGHYCFIEWPDRAPGLMPDDAVKINIDVHNHQRTFILTV